MKFLPLFSLVSIAFSSVASASEVGVLLASHGDIDSLAELPDYIRLAFLKNVGIPLPGWIREPLSGPALALSREVVEDQYKAIGISTGYRASSQSQAGALQAVLAEKGFDAKVYFGFNFTHPLIEETLEAMKKDGVKTIIVLNKGAQNSAATVGENVQDVESYFKGERSWNPKVIAVDSYSDDERFTDLLAGKLESDVQAAFPGAPSGDVCILVASHGLPLRMIEQGDRAVDMMRRAFARLQEKLPQYSLFHGFLNDDFFPGAEWVKPAASQVAETMRSDGCPNVLMDGRLSFTSHHRATFYDLNVVAREILERPDTLADGVTPHPLYRKPNVVLAGNFDGDKEFARYTASIVEEALSTSGPLTFVKVR